jgi:hypothetical protein
MAVSTTYLERYLAGEHEPVWDALVALGEQVRAEPVYSDALAVARETMRRVRFNIEHLIPRLLAVGYQFGYGWIQPDASTTHDWQQRQWYRDRLAWVHQQLPILSLPSDLDDELADGRRRLARLRELQAPPIIIDHWEQRTADLHAQPRAADKLDAFEEAFGVLPISVRAFYEQVEYVNFVGMHAGWSALLSALDLPLPQNVLEDGGSLFLYMEPLHVHPLPAAPDEHTHGTRRLKLLPLVPTKYASYGELGQDGYVLSIEVPCPNADVPIHVDTTFVAYLRECFRWGGFRGWGTLDKRPEEDLAFLTQGLQPI